MFFLNSRIHRADACVKLESESELCGRKGGGGVGRMRAGGLAFSTGEDFVQKSLNGIRISKLPLPVLSTAKVCTTGILG